MRPTDEPKFCWNVTATVPAESADARTRTPVCPLNGNVHAQGLNPVQFVSEPTIEVEVVGVLLPLPASVAVIGLPELSSNCSVPVNPVGLAIITPTWSAVADTVAVAQFVDGEHPDPAVEIVAVL